MKSRNERRPEQRDAGPTAGNTEVDGAGCFKSIVGRSPCMERLLNQMRWGAPHLRIGTIEGEQGTGKSLVAEQLWLRGPSHQGPLVYARASDLNIAIREATAAIHEAEHHTDGPHGRDGYGWGSLCKRASGGMLLIEDVDRLSAVAQTTILEYLGQSSNIPPEDGDGAESMQLLVSSSRPLRSLVSAGSFSRELAFRLSAVRFAVPPLRERREDMSLLADHFITVCAARYGKVIRGLDPGALARLLNHDWPGNVRELESVIEAACLEVEVQWIRPIDLRFTPDISSGSVMEDLTLDGAIHRHIAEILSRTRGNKLRTARLLGISRSTLYRILQPG